jgi:hypothetical protein
MSERVEYGKIPGSGYIIRMDNLITSTVAAGIIGCDESRVRQLCREGLLKGQKIGRDWLVDRASAEAYRDRPAGKGRPRTRPQVTSKREAKTRKGKAS